MTKNKPVKKDIEQASTVPSSPKDVDKEVLKSGVSVASKILAEIRKQNALALELSQKAKQTLANAAEMGQPVGALTQDTEKLQSIKGSFDTVLGQLRDIVATLKNTNQLTDQLSQEAEHKGPRLKS